MSTTLRYTTVMKVYGSWAMIRGVDHALTTEAIYRRLFELEPKARILFDFGGDENFDSGNDDDHHRILSNPTFRLHVHSLFDMLDLVVNSLGPDLEPLADELVELGKRHRGRGVRPDHLQVMDRAFVDGIGALLGDRCTQDDRDAWREIFRFLIEHMSAGMA
jgi:Globin